MKKLFILAAAALVAAAACTKTEVVNNTPDQAIAFQVANYVPQTKAGEVKFDESKTFNTYAWFHPTSGSAQVFMNNETIKWKEASKQWAAERIYFWPKTGYVNFFSYAGSPVPAVTDGSATYTDKTIATTDDAVLASAAYRYSVANAAINTYSLQYGTANTDVTGVPTLFHHILSQVTVIVKFDATGTDALNKWDLVINDVALIYANQGSLEVNFTDAGTTGQAWPFTTAGYNWVPKTGAANNKLSGTDNLGDANKQTTTGGSVSAGKTLFDAVSVMPQDLTAATGSNARLALNYTLTHYYDNVQQIVETVNLFDEGTDHLGSISLTDFTVETINAWNMNYKYTYTVTIKPNLTVSFDPAVEPWQEKSAGYTYPND